MDHEAGLRLLRKLMGETKTKTEPDKSIPVDRVLKKITPVTPDKISEQEERSRLKELTSLIEKLRADLGPRYSDALLRPLEKFSVYHPEISNVLMQVRKFRNSLDSHLTDGTGAIFIGTAGTGKDHLLAWLLYEVAELGVTCRWINGQDIFGTFRDRMDRKLPEDEYLSSLCCPTVLAISDPIPASGDPSAWNIGQLYRLVDRRYRHLKSTWFTMNVKNIEQAEDKLSVPVFDRIRDSAEIFLCFWPSYRERKHT